MSTTLALHSLPLDRSLADPGSRSVGYLLMLSVPLASMLCLEGVQIAGFNYTGWIWVGQLLATGFCLLCELAIHKRLPVAMPYRPWIVWCGFMALSLVWCDAWSLRNVQDLIQIGMPVLMACAASVYVRSEAQLRRLLRLFALAALTSLVLLIAIKLGLLGADTTEGQRGLGLTAAVAGTVLVAGSRNSLLMAVAGWAFCLVVTVLTGSRMATFALMLAPVFHPLYRSLLVKSLVLIALGGLGIAVFHTPVFQARFFDSGSGTLGDVFRGDFLSLGRFESWPDIWDEAWRRPILGHGIGTATKFVSLVWPEVSLVHNDYLRIGFELGLAGLAIFVVVVGWQLFAIRRLLKDLCQRATSRHRALPPATTHSADRPMGPAPRSRDVEHALAAAFLGLVVFLIMACTDNPLTYNVWFTNPVFVLLGGAYGVLRAQSEARESHASSLFTSSRPPWGNGNEGGPAKESYGSSR